MTPTARMIANALLDHHRTFCEPHLPRPPIIKDCVITYGRLCREARTPGLEMGIGQFLQEVAEWCAEHGHEPLNALAVNADSGHPGDSYDLAPGCSTLGWEDEVKAAILYQNYPEAV